jgi:hypothetical protein
MRRMTCRAFMVVMIVVVVMVMPALLAATANAAHWSFSSG